MKIKREMPVSVSPTLKSAFSLGTIVKVRQDADQKYMIIGYATDIVPYAYYAAPWPQGFIDGDSVFLIEPNEISGIVAAGTQNTESVLFLQALDEVMQKETIYDSERTENDAQRYAGRRYSVDPECFGRIGIRTSHGAGDDRR